MISIIDYGMGNLRSVAKAVERAGEQARIIRTPSELAVADKLILPGVGAFGDAMANLARQELIEPIRQYIKQDKPLLGICLGLQLLFSVGYEDGEYEGLDAFKGECRRFDFSHLPPGGGGQAAGPVEGRSNPSALGEGGRRPGEGRSKSEMTATGEKLSVPHMGWNAITWERPCPLLAGLKSPSFVYFVHSYHVVPKDSGIILTRTMYGYEFVSSIWRGNLMATQFHPEKSQAVGLKMVENFVRL